MYHLFSSVEKWLNKLGLSKKETCLRGRVAVWPCGRSAEIIEPFYEPFYKCYKNF